LTYNLAFATQYWPIDNGLLAMTGNIAQLNESVPTDGELVGSFFSGNQSHVQARSSKQGHCPVCDGALLPQSKFCGDCGSPAQQSTDTNSNNINSHQLHTQGAHADNVPAFAQVSQQISKAIPPELKKEYRKLTTLLIRERFFLLSHYLIFLFSNLLGFWMSFKAYHGLFYADEISRTVMALFPLFFINCVALGCLVPIKGTKKEIARLKERMTYLHYQIEYMYLA
jgi:hypothetical protein